jgi:hypothetical protein
MITAESSHFPVQPFFGVLAFALGQPEAEAKRVLFVGYEVGNSEKDRSSCRRVGVLLQVLPRSIPQHG